MLDVNDRANYGKGNKIYGEGRGTLLSGQFFCKTKTILLKSPFKNAY